MTRILVPRGSGSSLSNQSLPSSSSVPQSSVVNAPSTSKEEEQERDVLQDPRGLDELVEQMEGIEEKSIVNCDELLPESSQGLVIGTGSGEVSDKERSGGDEIVDSMQDLELDNLGRSDLGSSQIVLGGSNPPPPPVPPPKPPASNFSSRRVILDGSNTGRVGSSRRMSGWPVVSTRSLPSGSLPSSPRTYAEGEGYNSADEQGPCFVSSYDETVSSYITYVLNMYFILLLYPAPLFIILFMHSKV